MMWELFLVTCGTILLGLIPLAVLWFFSKAKPYDLADHMEEENRLRNAERRKWYGDN